MTVINSKSFHSTIANNNSLQTSLIEKYAIFSIENVLLKLDSIENTLRIVFVYGIENLDYFTHQLQIKIDEHKFKFFLRQDYKYIQEFKKLINSTAIIEAINYWKLTTSPNFYIKENLNEDEIEFYKKIYFKGLSEFFYRNNIDIQFETFLNFKNISNRKEQVQNNFLTNNLLNDGYIDIDLFFNEIINSSNDIEKIPNKNDDISSYISDDIMIPIGGGKDSAVSLEILKNYPRNIYSFRINNNQAAIDCEEIAHIDLNKRLNIIRIIDKKLLEYNNLKFLNGHIPFSAILAHLAFIFAKLYGIKFIALSNEASANSSYVEGLDVNHQWSKSLEFELLFREHANKYFDRDIYYLSILRPFSELSIAKKFAQLNDYFPIFRSCNLGSKNNANIWCANCPKCLFVFIILSAFIDFEDLLSIFSTNLLDNKELEDDFGRLSGKISTRPFECVGESTEVRYALAQLFNKLNSSNYKSAYLLNKFITDVKNNIYDDLSLIDGKIVYTSNLPLGSLDLSTIPNELKPFVKQMAKDINVPIQEN